MCLIIGNETKCNPMCLTCSKNSYCGNPHACTSCYPGDYKISPSFYDENFECSKECNGDPLQHGDYYFCDEHVDFGTGAKMDFTTTHPPMVKTLHTCIISIALVIILIFVFVVIKIFINKKPKKKGSFKIIEDVEKQPLKLAKIVRPIPIKHQAFKKLEMITNICDFEKGEEIGGGTFSVVFRGKLRGKSVAIKIARDEGRRSIHKELQIYDKVSHPNILPALGVHFGVDNMLFLSLRNFNLKDYFIYYGKDINFDQQKQYCIQLADAMKYLHNKNILHCDLKIDNILIKDDKAEQIEISDFGCAIDLEHDHCNKYVGTQTHTAYELLKNRRNLNSVAVASKASDVWALAVTVWQILQKSHQLPSDFIKPDDIIKNYETGKKLPLPITASEDLWRYIILPCFDLYPKARPSMEDLHKSLLRFREDPNS